MPTPRVVVQIPDSPSVASTSAFPAPSFRPPAGTHPNGVGRTVHLKSLTLKGFKSFASSTSLEF
ncbi:MAG: hypothetical protein VX682_00280, partial [Actinomycetota bacterium]|nr:hypothetical protein [Actinomycetota bacterium]